VVLARPLLYIYPMTVVLAHPLLYIYPMTVVLAHPLLYIYPMTVVLAHPLLYIPCGRITVVWCELYPRGSRILLCPALSLVTAPLKICPSPPPPRR
jgi:hypothetical protein